ncbi:MAG: HD domain-containing protein [Phycisphaerae bacterium]|nr:HD domain-containing protein [Phycisphaerae bacterium]
MTQTITTRLSALQLDSLRNFAKTVNRFDANFFAFDAGRECLLEAPAGCFQSDPGQIAQCVEQVLQDNRPGVRRFNDASEIFTLCLRDGRHTVAVAVVHAGTDAQTDLAADGETRYLAELLSLFGGDFQNTAKAAGQLEKVCTELSETYEELMLLYNLSSHMKVTQTDATYLQMACDQLTQLVSVEGIAIFLEKKIDGEKRLTLTAGSGLVTIDAVMADILQVHLARELNSGKEALLDSNVDTSFKYEWPERIKNILAVPLNGADSTIGLMVATNILDKPDFDSTDVKLFNTVAHQCAVFMENGRLFGDLKELFVGALKALTNSIDAKDQYTRGHSERVAFISRWIAERLAENMPLEEEEIHRIYLAGLLHDVGKIGVNEAVLQKKGKLTDDELARIKAHPQIGASILSEIKQMREIVPGVLCHHERVDGKGYPKGLTGDQIPLIGKIISLADAFDAMTSKRVYREALSIKRAIAEIKKGIGTQFDPEVAGVFIDSDIRKLWSIIQDGFIESWDYSNFSEYGTIAVGTLIR